jgi:hypothetical protein
MSSGVSRYLIWVEWGGTGGVYWELRISMKDDLTEGRFEKKWWMWV